MGKIYIKMNKTKVKKSITVSKKIDDMIKELSEMLQVNENAVISIAMLEYYTKVGKNIG